ncbi:restriction endonuclease [Mesorhizobium opportunistum]|uniref:Restriction endonuclease n=1 Tax=Mesorhizobium opportunistum TaxID=593909 RepID=A0ABV1YB90_9HYPH
MTFYGALRPWQKSFVDSYLADPGHRSLLVAPPGMGKTSSALAAAQSVIAKGDIDAVLVVSPSRVLVEQWRYAAASAGIVLAENIHVTNSAQGMAATAKYLSLGSIQEELGALARARRWMIIADDYQGGRNEIRVIDRILSENAASIVLHVSHELPKSGVFDTKYSLSREFILDRESVESPQTNEQLIRFAPSLTLIGKLQYGIEAIDDISWRQFEKLIATLLEADGYNVELMKGSKDGGVDVIAVKDLGASGYYKSLWQAKKWGRNHKVGISTVRELADTRLEFGASKAIVVTTSFLTQGALDRVERDKYLLSKVDRQDLDGWVRRTLFQR